MPFSIIEAVKCQERCLLLFLRPNSNNQIFHKDQQHGWWRTTQDRRTNQPTHQEPTGWYRFHRRLKLSIQLKSLQNELYFSFTLLSHWTPFSALPLPNCKGESVYFKVKSKTKLAKGESDALCLQISVSKFKLSSQKHWTSFAFLLLKSSRNITAEWELQMVLMLSPSMELAWMMVSSRWVIREFDRPCWQLLLLLPLSPVFADETVGDHDLEDDDLILAVLGQTGGC